MKTNVKEKWLPIKANENYEVSDYGRVRHTYQNKKVKYLTLSSNCQNERDYLFVQINGMKHYIHILVLETFIGKRPYQHDCDHINGNRHDNTLTNLQYLHRSINRSHKGEKHGLSKLTNRLIKVIKQLYFQGYMQKDIAELLEVSRSTISNVLTGKTWSHV